MFPLSDENRVLRTPLVTILLLVALALVWVLVQGASLDPTLLAATICNLGLVPAELTHTVAVGTAVPIGPDLACVVDDDAINVVTPLTSMFLHGSWGHLLGNGLFLWVFGRAVEDGMGRLRFLAFYLLVGLLAAAAQVAVTPSSAVPMVGASGAISGVMGAYLLLYPRVRVRVLFIFIIFFRVIPIPAWIVLIYWFVSQLLLGLPSLSSVSAEVSMGVAVWAHIGGFVGGALLVRRFSSRELIAERQRLAWRG
jgi:membrane associated rhomboid family serine protease